MAAATPGHVPRPDLVQPTSAPTIHDYPTGTVQDPPSSSSHSQDPGENPSSSNPSEPKQDPASQVDKPPAPNQQISSIGGHKVQPAQGNGIIVGSSTLRPGVQTKGDDGTPLSVGSDLVVVDGIATIPLKPPPAKSKQTADAVIPLKSPPKHEQTSNAVIMNFPAPTPIILNGHTIVREPADPTQHKAPQGASVSGGSDGGSVGNGVVIAGSTYSPGVTTKLPNGTPLSVETDHIVIAGSSHALLPAAAPSPVLIAGKSIFRVSDGNFVIGSSTIHVGAPSATVYGHAISIDSSFAVVDRSTYFLPATSKANAAAPNGPSRSALTLADGTIITAGSPAVTVSSKTVSLDQEGTSLFVNGKPFSVPSFLPPNTVFATLPGILSVAGQTFTPEGRGFSIGIQAVKPGASAITIAGTKVSLDSGGHLTIGNSVTTLPISTATSGAGPEATIGGVAIKGGLEGSNNAGGDIHQTSSGMRAGPSGLPGQNNGSDGGSRAGSQSFTGGARGMRIRGGKDFFGLLMVIISYLVICM